MPPFKVPTIHDGVVVLPLFGVILLKSSRPPALRLDKTLVITDSSKRLHDQNIFRIITSRGPGRVCPGGLRCPGGSVDRCATRRPSPSAADGQRPRWLAWILDAS